MTRLTPLLLCASVMLVGCEQYYRYPCQDPNNWELDECKKPLCEVNRDCPDLIFNGNKPAVDNSKVPPPPPKSKGAC